MVEPLQGKTMFLDQSLFTSIETSSKRAQVRKKLEGREDVLNYARLVMDLNDSGATFRQKIDISSGDEELARAIEPLLERDEDNVITNERRLAGERGYQFRYSPLTYLIEQEPYSHTSRSWVASPRQLEKEYRAELGLPERFDARCNKVWKFHPGQVLQYLDFQRRENPPLFLLLLGDDIEAAETLFPQIQSVPSESVPGTEIEADIFPDMKCSVATAFRIMREVKRAGAIVLKLGEFAVTNLKSLKELLERSDAALYSQRQNQLIQGLGNSTFELFRRVISCDERKASFGVTEQPIGELKTSLLYTAAEAGGSLPCPSDLNEVLAKGSEVKRLPGRGGRRIGELACYFGFDITELGILMAVQTSASAHSACSNTNVIREFSRDWLLQHGVRKRSPTSTNPSSIKDEKVIEVRALDHVMFGERNKVLRHIGFLADNQHDDRQRAEDWLTSVSDPIPAPASDRKGLARKSIQDRLCKLAIVPMVSRKRAISAVPLAVGQLLSVGAVSLDPFWSRHRESEMRLAMGRQNKNEFVNKIKKIKAKKQEYKKNNRKIQNKIDPVHCSYDAGSFLINR